PRVRAGRAGAAPLGGGSVLGTTAVAGAQSGGDRPRAEADRPPDGHGPGLDAAAQALNLSVDDVRSKLEGGATIAQVAQQQGDVPYVFDRFWRAGRARGPPGSAPGPAIARQVADQHHATVTVEPPADGGTRMRLRFP